MEKKKKALYLPDELIILILLKLPVNSLIRFKQVCKLWFSLISDPQFASSHFEHAASPTRKIVWISFSSNEIRSINFEASLSDVSPPFNIDFMPLPRALTPEIKGSCRGILFLHDCLKITLWNPSTGFHKQIPVSPFDSETHFFSNLHGFGYDHSRDDYLLVVLSCEETYFSSHLELFSFKNNSWKQIEGNYGPYYNRTSVDPKGGSLCNGAIHWLTSRSYDFSVDVILAFDLMERKLVEMPLPDEFDRNVTYRDLWIFGEFLSLWTMDNDTFKVFVMKEHKVHSSWTQTLVLRIDGVSTQNFYPVCCTKNGDIIATVHDGTELVKLNDEGQLLGNQAYGDQPFMFQVVMYTESLLSLPDGDGE